MRSRLLPPLHCLVAFDAAARQASFTKAAADLHLTQSAVSRQIAQLETFLGRPLFTRDHHRLTLTTAGQRYFEQVGKLLTECSEATAELTGRRGQMELTVACSSGVAVLWMARQLVQFRVRYPEVKLRVVVKDRLQMLASSEFDLGVYFVRDRLPDGFDGTRLFDEEVFAVCSPSYLAGRVMSVQALGQETFLALEDGQRHWMSWNEWFERIGHSWPNTAQVLTADNYPLLVEMAIAGGGVLLAWRHMIDECLRAQTLVPICSETARSGGGYHLVWPADRHLHHAARLLRQWLASRGQAVRVTQPMPHIGHALPMHSAPVR